MKPALRIEVAGKDKTDQWCKRMISLSVTDYAGGEADCLEAEFDDREEKGVRLAAPPAGTEIRVWLGYEPSPHYMGRFKVDEWTKRGPLRTLSISARSADLTTAIRARKTRAWDGKAVGDIASKIASEHGLAALVAAKIATVQIPHIDQQNESDVAFLSRLAKRNGATFKLADGKLILAEKGSSRLPSGEAKPIVTLRPGDGSDWRAGTQTRGDYKSVRCAYMDHKAGKRIFVTAGSGAPVHSDGKLYGSAIEARKAAEAQLSDLKRGMVALEVRGLGRVDLFAGALVKAEGFDPDVDGEYVARTVSHSLGSGGFSTEVDLEKAGE